MRKSAIRWPKGQTRYIVLADHLMKQIQQGQYKPGEYLPTEAQICSAYGVSRFTVRQAIQELQQRGNIITHHGIGSQVIRTEPVGSEFSFSFDSVDDFIKSGKDLKIEVALTDTRGADERVADMLECSPGAAYVFVEGRRVANKDAEVVACFELFIPAEYAGITGQIGRRRKVVSQQIEEKYDLRTAQIHQTMEPVLLNRAQSAVLGLPSGSAGLLVCRTYIDVSRGVFLHARNTHAGKHSLLSMEIRRKSG